VISFDFGWLAGWLAGWLEWLGPALRSDGHLARNSKRHSGTLLVLSSLSFSLLHRDSSLTLFPHPFLPYPASGRSSSLTSRDLSLPSLPLHLLPALSLRESPPRFSSPLPLRIASFSSRSRFNNLRRPRWEWKLGTVVNNFADPKVATCAPWVQWKLECIFLGRRAGLSQAVWQV